MSDKGKMKDETEIAGGTRIYTDPLKPIGAEVSLKPPERYPTDDQGLWVPIRNRTKAIGFQLYKDFIDRVLCRGEYAEHGGTCAGETNEKEIGAPSLDERRSDIKTRPTIQGVDAYNLLRMATEVFLVLNAGVVKVTRDSSGNVTTVEPLDKVDVSEEETRLGRSIADIKDLLVKYFGTTGRLQYLDSILENLPVKDENLPYCEAVLQHRLNCPSMLELIWSYWHEEGMLVQTLNAITLRFQNRRGGDRDPLSQLEIDPLRPLNNLLWGYIQDEQHRLSVVRRAYEYDHHYGITLYGKVVPALRSADSRSKFLEAFHNLLYRSAVFYREDADTTVVSDGFPLLNALKEVHLVLAEGAHNQFGDLPWTARVEMLIQQWLLARPEMKEFLRGRAMVPYKETWMGQVDAMKKLQGWTDITITHFHDLAVFGEQILLSVRYGDWNNVVDQEQAKNWARYWKPEIQGYSHAYRAVTGVDLTTEPVDATPPYVHLRRQEEQKRRAVPV